MYTKEMFKSFFYEMFLRKRSPTINDNYLYYKNLSKRKLIKMMMMYDIEFYELCKDRKLINFYKIIMKKIHHLVI